MSVCILTPQSIFAANVAKIEKHNAEAAAGKHTWTQGVNQFTDLTVRVLYHFSVVY